MSDSYLKFANTKFGAKLTAMLGLPQPLELRRHPQSQSFANSTVLLGGNERSTLLTALSDQLESMGIQPLRYSPEQKIESTAWQPDSPVNALLFDATGLQASGDGSALYQYFNQTARALVRHGRVLVFGRTPTACRSAEQATVQRALEGFTRSLAKELGKAITVQLVYVSEGSETQLESTLRFFLAPQSAYVSGQVVYLSAAKTPVTEDTVQEVNEGDAWQLPFTGQKVLVTGATQGIGLAIAETMAREGAHVVCLDIPSAEQALTQLANRLGGSVIALDLAADNAHEILRDAAVADGGWDVIVHNAGITKDKTLAKMPESWWSSLVNINLSVQERINHSLLQSGGLKQGGRIVCVSSISGIAGNRGQTNYAFSKAGVIGMVKSHAPRLAEKGITINAVAPGFIETKMTAKIPFAVREAGRRLNSLSQGGLPVDVAETIVWLAHPKSSALNGNVVRVCGQSLLGA